MTSIDIMEDGILDDTSLGSQIINHATYLDKTSIRENLENRYNALGIDAAIPDFEKYLDQFISSTNCPVTKALIDYPAQGKYGTNLLSLDAVEPLHISSGRYSIMALLPEALRLTVTIQFYEPHTWSIHEWPGWTYNWLSNADRVLAFYDDQVSEELDVDIYLTDSGSAKITVYEDNRELPTKVIQISW